MVQLKVTNDTWFKLSAAASSSLDDSQKVFIDDGEEFEIHSYGRDKTCGKYHIKVAFKNVALGPQKRNTWYVFTPHILLDGNELNNKPNDKPDPNPILITAKPQGPFKLPGFKSTFYLNQPIIKGGNFSWAEATKNGSRIPTHKNVVYRILRIADVMEEVREYMGGRSITVNSWYRDPITNRRVGGARNSRHIQGDAVDFVVAGIPPMKVHRKLESWWGSRGGIASATVFTHIDARGYRARWSYGY